MNVNSRRVVGNNTETRLKRVLRFCPVKSLKLRFPCGFFLIVQNFADLFVDNRSRLWGRKYRFRLVKKGFLIT